MRVRILKVVLEIKRTAVMVASVLVAYSYVAVLESSHGAQTRECHYGRTRKNLQHKNVSEGDPDT